MNWDGWSGFQGEGTYVILNRKSLLSLQMDHHREISTGYASILDFHKPYLIVRAVPTFQITWLSYGKSENGPDGTFMFWKISSTRS